MLFSLSLDLVFFHPLSFLCSFNGLASLLFSPTCLPSVSTNLLQLQIFAISGKFLAFCLLGLIVLVRRSRQAVRASARADSWSRLLLTGPSLSCSRFTQEGGCFARTVESRLGCLVIYLRHFSLLGYLVALQTSRPDRCFLRIRGEGVS
jgi:hypothetical protein